MISLLCLRESLEGDWIAFDKNGAPLQVDIPGSLGPASFLVAPVTDALKRVDDGALESLDRDQMWAVEAIVLNRVVLSRLAGDEMTTEELLTAVRDLGYSWQISPISSP